MMLEVTVFYLQILTLIIWQALEYVGLMTVEPEDDDPDSDSIESYVTSFALLSAGLTSSIVNFMIINMEGNEEFLAKANIPEDASTYGWSLYMNAILNVWFTLAMYLLFVDKCDFIAGLMICILMCWLIVQIIIDIVVVCVNGSEY